MASATDALVYSVLAECGVKNLPMERYLFRDRLELPVISQIQLAEILLDAHRMDDFKKVMPIISQFLQQDDSCKPPGCAFPMKATGGGGTAAARPRRRPT